MRMRFSKSTLFAVSLAVLPAAGTSHPAPVTIKSGNVIGSSLPGNMAHHMHQTQHDFSRLVSIETGGEVELEILEGKRKDLPVFRLPE